MADGAFSANKDFNNITRTGIWFCNTWTGGWSNSPEQAILIGIVGAFNTDRVVQIFVGNNVWARQKYNGTWSAWAKLN